MALLDDYRIYLKEQGKAKNTIQTYSRHVDEYCRWYRDTFGEELTLLYHTNILDFRSYLQNVKRLKFKSIDTKLSSLSSFNEFLIKSGIQEDLVIMQEDRLKFQQEIASPADIEKRGGGCVSAEGFGKYREAELCHCNSPGLRRSAGQ